MPGTYGIELEEADGGRSVVAMAKEISKKIKKRLHFLESSCIMAIAVTLIALKREVAISLRWVFRGANVKRSASDTAVCSGGTGVPQKCGGIGKPDGKSLYEPYFLPQSR